MYLFEARKSKCTKAFKEVRRFPHLFFEVQHQDTVSDSTAASQREVSQVTSAFVLLTPGGRRCRLGHKQLRVANQVRKALYKTLLHVQLCAKTTSFKKKNITKALFNCAGYFSHRNSFYMLGCSGPLSPGSLCGCMKAARYEQDFFKNPSSSWIRGCD